MMDFQVREGLSCWIKEACKEVGACEVAFWKRQWHNQREERSEPKVHSKKTNVGEVSGRRGHLGHLEDTHTA